mmetsp:Transcript_29520/g.57088  ORF Transcript_29520/g.57088 Transcript_29520/m.57088 type:complete len:287 (-) Transcript_29520:609-1469(-)
MMPLVATSTAAFSASERPLSFFIALPSSAARTCSNLACSSLMAGTYLSDSCQARNLASSARSSTSASRIFSLRLAWLRATTCLRSSTLYAFTPSTLLHSDSTLRGTEMSIRTRGCGVCPQTRSRSSGSVTMHPVALVDVKTSSEVSTVCQSSSISPTWMSKSGYSAASSSARGRERLSSVTLVTPCEARWVSSRRDILPAPIMATRTSFRDWERSSGHLSTASSTAAEEMETAPFAISVSDRTYFPDMTAVLSSLPRTLPALPGMASSSVSVEIACEWHAFTCDKI